MTRCTFGLHAWNSAFILEVRDGELVEVEIVYCCRCLMRVSEEVWSA